MSNPKLAITLGDPAGVGAETIVGAWSQKRVHQAARPFVVGCATVLRRAVDLLASELSVVEIDSAEEADPSPEVIPCLAAGGLRSDSIEPAVASAAGGQAAYDALKLATRLALDKSVDGIVTAPLNKAALHAAGHHYPGHTELLAEFCGVERTAMMLYLPPGVADVGPAGLGVVHVTLHISMRDALDQMTQERVLDRIQLADDALCRMVAHTADFSPRIGVCALNPHAGEEGLFGDEEQRVIAPAVERARSLGKQVEGPLPSDTLMVRAAAGEFDAVVAMYHDQGHIALKLLGMQRAVNVTLGLPVVRTSVAHGTAFDRAWQGTADSQGMVEAISTAAHLASVSRSESHQSDAVVRT